MDNISHSLVGLAFAESVYQCYEKKTVKPNPFFQKCLWVVAFIASNFPDLDYFYVLLLRLGRLGALLHHRGHTHSLSMAIPQGLLITGFFFLIAKKNKWNGTLLQWMVFLGLSIGSIGLHIGLDAINSYGTHPFWPWNNHWYYLDSVFIVEPLFWVTFTPLLFFSARSVILRTVFSSLFFAIIILCWFSGLVLPELALGVTLSGALLAVLAVRSKEKRYLHGVTWTFSFLFLGFFHQMSAYSNAQVTDIVKQGDPGTVIHDVVLSPLPANPFCWGTLVVKSLGPVKTYTVQRGITTPFPNFIGLERCLKNELASRYLQLGQVHSDKNVMHSFGSQEFSIERFRFFAKTHCGFSSWLRFARVPAFEEKEGKLVARDMRFDLRSPNFTEMEFPIDMPVIDGCGLQTDWEMPRRDLLD